MPTFDATSSSSGSGSGAKTLSHTCTGTDRILLVKVSINTAFTIDSLTYNGVALAQITAVTQAAVNVSLWWLIAPATGANNIVLTLSGPPTDWAMGGESYTGVHQTVPKGTESTAQGSSTTASVAVSSAVDDMVVDSVGSDVRALTCHVSQTQRHNVGTAKPNGGSDEVAVGSSTTMSWTLTSGDWAIIGVALKPSGPPPDPLVGSLGDFDPALRIEAWF